MNDNIREGTYNDMIEKLQKYKKCVILRPTGFGKTWLLTSLVQSKLYSRILYLYPAKVIKDTIVNKYFDDMYDDVVQDMDIEDAFDADEETIELAAKIAEMKKNCEIDGLTMMTYSKLARTKASEFLNDEYDLIIVDECHRIGGVKTKLGMSKLLAKNPNAAIVGATATPNRADGFDVIHTFFNDICTFEYNLHDAFQDGLLQVPNYCYCTTDAEADLKDEALRIGEDIEDEYVLDVIKKQAIEISNLFNMESIIKDVCDRYVKDTSYMKFIAFFSNFKHVDMKLKEINDWFKSAYPNHKINNLIITSQTKEFADNVSKLETLTRKKDTIDIIACVDMLNMGYHVNDLTGIVMYRGTSSDIIYIQQLGRVLSSGNKNASIVFDIVDNLHRKAVYDLAEPTAKKMSKTKLKNATQSLGWHVDDNNNVTDINNDIAPIFVKDGEVYDLAGNKTDLVINDDGTISDNPNYKSSNIKENCNKFYETDLHMTGNIASYKELIAKVVCEPMSMRCRQVIELHFKKWCKINNLPYPITEKMLKLLSSLTKDDFRKEFTKIVESNNLDYPIHDAERLLSIGQADGVVPMRIFAKWKNVRISEILKLLGLEDEKVA